MDYSLLSKHRAKLMGVAMLWVMVFHINFISLPWRPLEYVRALGFGGVDIFIVLSMMGLYMSLARRQQEYGEFMGRRLLRIVPSYYAVMIPYTVCLMIAGRANLSSLFWNATMLNYWVRPLGAFNWYVTGIVTFYAVTPFFAKRLGRSRHPIPFTLAGVLVGFAVSIMLITDNYWGYLDIPYRITVFFIGLLIGRFVTEGRKFRPADYIVWAAVLVLGGVFALVYDKFDFYIPLCFLFAFTTVPMCLVLSWLFEKLPELLLGKLFKLLGTCSLEIYLLNVSLFSETEFLMRYLDFDEGHYVYAIITLTLNILLGVLLHKLIALVTNAINKRKKPSVS